MGSFLAVWHQGTDKKKGVRRDMLERVGEKERRTDSDEKFVNVDSCLGRSFGAKNAIFFSIVLSVLDGNGAMFGKINLVSNERNYYVRIGLFLELLHPVLRLFKRLRTCNVVYNDGGCGLQTVSIRNTVFRISNFPQDKFSFRTLCRSVVHWRQRMVS